MLWPPLALALLAVGANANNQASYNAVYKAGRVDLEFAFAKGPNFKIPDRQCSGHINLTDPRLQGRFCGRRSSKLPVVLELSFRDVWPVPLWHAKNHELSAFTAYRAACLGAAYITTRVVCLGRRDELAYEADRPEEWILLPPAPHHSELEF